MLHSTQGVLFCDAFDSTSQFKSRAIVETIGDGRDRVNGSTVMLRIETGMRSRCPHHDMEQKRRFQRDGQGTDSMFF